jgi:hypothetical protein
MNTRFYLSGLLCLSLAWISGCGGKSPEAVKKQEQDAGTASARRAIESSPLPPEEKQRVLSTLKAQPGATSGPASGP